MKIAFLGGSFDPVHAEHINIARAAAVKLQADKIIVVRAAPVTPASPLPISGRDTPTQSCIFSSARICSKIFIPGKIPTKF